MRIKLRRRNVIVMIVGIALLATPIAGVVVANAIVMEAPSTLATELNIDVTEDSLKPDQCDDITITTLLTGSGEFAGTNNPTLLIGSTGVDEITGGSGDDCILGGLGNDTLIGGDGNDVCIGHAGTTFDATCETTDPPTP